MIRGLILYYLNIKPTHGYEIQRFIQIWGLDQWAKIQSGSIYYALTRLEKEKNIAVQREERTGSRVRKIYEITEQGKKTLHDEMREELSTPIAEAGSLKFITEPILSTLNKSEMEVILKGHIAKLKEKKEFWELWKEAKSGNGKLTDLSFEITIDALNNQIRWHEELQSNLDEYMKESEQLKEVIRFFEPDRLDAKEVASEKNQKIEFMEQIKQMLEDDPNGALERLNRMIDALNHQK